MWVKVPHFEDGLPGGPRIGKLPIGAPCSVFRFTPFPAESGSEHGDVVSRPGVCSEDPGPGCCGRAYEAQSFYFGRECGHWQEVMPCHCVRSLLQYRKATTTPECRKGRKKLFISYKASKSDEIKRTTISYWIVKLIRLAYESEGSDPRTLELHKVSAHEVRALSASASVFCGMALDTVLQSCTWRSRNTFSDFYLRLRDMCSFLDDIFVMSSSVAGT